MLKIRSISGALLIAATICVSVVSSRAGPVGSEDANNQTAASPARAPIFHESNQEQTGPQQNAKKQGKDNYGSLRENERLLMKELKAIQKSESYKKGVFKVELVDDNLYEWRVNMTFPDPECSLHWSLKRLKYEGRGEHVVFKMSFTENYPSEPPFVRIIYPTLYGGQVQLSGVLCMRMLSKNGWSSDYSMEGFILAIGLHLASHETRIKFSMNTFSPYSEDEARKIFEGLVKSHEADKSWAD